jgi:hypothetical protein
LTPRKLLLKSAHPARERSHVVPNQKAVRWKNNLTQKLLSASHWPNLAFLQIQLDPQAIKK